MVAGLLSVGACVSIDFTEPAAWEAARPDVSVEVRETGYGTARYVASVEATGDYDGAEPIGRVAEFCAASTFSVDEFVASDASGSFVGAYTGTYYQFGNRERIVGDGSVVKVMDAEAARGLFVGREFYRRGLVNNVLDYRAVFRGGADGYTLTFQDLKTAQKSTGSMPNSGFTPLGTWEGSGAEDALTSIDAAAARFQDCMLSVS